ncbi:MAG TPA: peptidase [Lachnospiraceae bacterium]|nr:peptidase [Lachnospiraceae bacterium]
MRISIKGTIVPNDVAWIYDLFDEEHVAPADVLKALEDADGEDVDIDINSGGGDVFAGSEIYSAIRAYKGNINIHVVGLAASAASVIACAAHSDIAPTAQVMVHNVSSYAGGDYHDMDKMSKILKQANRSIAAAYVAKSGMSEADALDLMDKESWITASDAVEYGLIDEIAESQNSNYEAVRLQNAAGGMLPRSVIEKMQAKRNALLEYFTD